MSSQLPTSQTSSDHLHDVHNTPIDSAEKTIKQRIEIAKAHCQTQGIRFTKLREQVYRLILQAEQPIGAYDLISAMQAEQSATSTVSKTANNNKTSNIAPPTVYRSLNFLLSAGFIHQLTSLNAFVPCCHPREKHLASFLICNVCQRVQECHNESVRQLVAHTKNSIGFAVDKTIIEMTGICQKCQDGGDIIDTEQSTGLVNG